MPDAVSENERSKKKDARPGPGEVTGKAGEIYQSPMRPKGHWSKKRKAEVVIRTLRG